MSGIQWAGIVITVVLFMITHAFALFKWVSSITTSLKGITEKFEERTSALVYDIRTIRASMEQLASTVVRFEHVEAGHRDHEDRIRLLERACVLVSSHEERISQLEIDNG